MHSGALFFPLGWLYLPLLYFRLHLRRPHYDIQLAKSVTAQDGIALD